MPRPDRETGGEVIEKPKPKTRKPRLFHVVLHNDDHTTMEFVVKVLQTVFGKPEPEAFRIMMQVHLDGKGICGAYTYEVAETKAATVHDMAQGAGYPLRASVEEA
jgi:ATP-dependent Clp protease adaptor protein ClpS